MKRSSAILLALVLFGIAAQASDGGRVRAPKNRAAPKIAGATVVGQTLAARRGKWANRPTAFRYAWQSCDGAGKSCARVRGAKRVKYRLAARDVGHRLRVLVTASNRVGRGTARSRVTPVVNSAGQPHYFGTDPSRDCIDRAEASCALANTLPRSASTCAS
jgi:hypothetical protein